MHHNIAELSTGDNTYAAPHVFSAEFTQAVDALIQDASISDDSLHTRAHQYLDVLAKSDPTELSGPRWADRIRKALPGFPAFATLYLFLALYHTADELHLLAGKRYVSATICVCSDHISSAAEVGGDGVPDSKDQSTNLQLVQALDDLASTWAAFVLWPFYAYGADDGLKPRPDRNWKFCRASPLGLTKSKSDSEAIETRCDRAQQHHWKLQVMARDNYRCFMSGYPDTDWFFKQNPEPDDEDPDFDDCDVVSIIERAAVLAQDEGAYGGVMSGSPDIDSNITRGILKRYFGVDETLLEKAEGPQNTLFVNTSACVGFRQFRWCLHPTEIQNRYEITRYAARHFRGARHVTSHVTFADHSQSQSQSRASSDSRLQTSPVDLPDRALLRLHAALAGVLWHSGAATTFDCLLDRPYWLPRVRSSCWPGPRGTTFWASVVEYEGDETCAEVDLDLSVEALREDMLESHGALAGSS